MKNVLLYLSMILILVGCSESDCGCVPTPIASAINISLRNASGNDLIDSPSYPKAWFRTSYLIDYNILVPQYNSRVSVSDDLPKKAQVFLNTTFKDDYSITYVEWSSTDTDTIKAHINRSNGTEFIDKIWINNVPQIYDRNPSTYVSIVK